MFDSYISEFVAVINKIASSRQKREEKAKTEKEGQEIQALLKKINS